MLMSVRNLVAGYGAIRIVAGVSFDLAAGRTLAVLGRNGVGKTTLLRSLVGLAERFSGEVLIDDRPLPVRDPRRAARLGMAFVPDNRGVFPRLTVAENMRLARLVAYGRARVDPFDIFPDLVERADQAAGTLSGGQQQQLAIGRALASGPRLLILDELSQGLQPSIVKSLADALRRVTREFGLALLMVEQNPDLAMSICENVIVLQRGEIVAAGASQRLASDPRLRELLIV
jgi:branched-chain amino acid transport system ATP-binding protein